MDGEFGYDLNGEGIFSGGFKTREDAIAEARVEGEGDSFATGKYEKVDHSINADSIIEQLQEDCYELCGDAADSFLMDLDKKVVDDLNGVLNAALVDWIKKHNLDTVFHVIDVQHHPRKNANA